MNLRSVYQQIKSMAPLAIMVCSAIALDAWARCSVYVNGQQLALTSHHRPLEVETVLSQSKSETGLVVRTHCHRELYIARENIRLAHDCVQPRFVVGLNREDQRTLWLVVGPSFRLSYRPPPLLAHEEIAHEAHCATSCLRNSLIVLLLLILLFGPVWLSERFPKLFRFPAR